MNNNFANEVLNASFNGLQLSDINNSEKVAEMLDKFGLKS